MSYTRNDEPLRDQFTTQFLDRFFPTQHSTAESTECRVSAEPSRLAGSYRPASFNRGDLFKIGALLYEYQVTTDCDCRFTLHYPSHHAPTHWIATAPLRIQRVSPATDTENDTAVFQADSSGAITHLFIGTRTGLIKLQWYETANLQFGLVGLFLLAFISAGPVGLGLELKRISRKSARPVSRGGLLAQWILILYGWLAAVLLIGLCIELFTIDPNEFNFGIPLLVQLLLRIPILLMALTVGLFIGTSAAWKFGYWSRSLRVLYGSIALIATVSLIFLRYWNLLPV